MDFDAISTAIMENKLVTPDTIYIDMMLMKDMYLGAILDMITTDNEYDYIYCNLDTYITRVIDDVELVFPKLNLKQADVVAHMSSGNQLAIFEKAPVTDMLAWFNSYIISINNKCATSKKASITKLIINTHPIKLPQPIAAAISDEFSMTYAMDVRIISKPFTEIPPDIIHKLDDIYIYDFNSFMEHPTYSKEFAAMVFENKKISAPRRISDIGTLKIHTTEEALEKDFIVTEGYIALMCQFAYLPKIDITRNK